MKTTRDAHEIMHYFESCVLHAYPDPASPLGKALLKAGLWSKVLAGTAFIPSELRALSGAPWTIGWGDTGPDVLPGLAITQQEADDRFERRLAREFEPGVEKLLLRTPMPHQFDAFVCLAYNIGLGQFRSSTALARFNAGNITGAFEALTWFNKAGGQVMKGLQRRRWAEFLRGTAAYSGSVAIAAALAKYR